MKGIHSKFIQEIALVDTRTVQRRIDNGWCLEDAISYPANTSPGDPNKLLLVGDKRWMFILLRQADPYVWYSKTTSAQTVKSQWECLCLCGNTKVIQSQNLKSGQTKSCGCLQKAIVSECNKVSPKRKKKDGSK